ncbi:hypothetical protein HDV00_011070 [Rhizophlyctis rosea]|nr:hypothetical protein HDV00_011070 [Rhizophlyctis rosea]
MAKGLRSKTKRHFRTIRRQEVFGPVEEARLQRLAQKQAEPQPYVEHSKSSTSAPTDTIPAEDSRGRAPADVDTQPEQQPAQEGMDVDAKPMTKIEKEKFMMTRNAFKKRQKARAKSLKRVSSGKVKKSLKSR